MNTTAFLVSQLTPNKRHIIPQVVKYLEGKRAADMSALVMQSALTYGNIRRRVLLM